MEHGGQRDRGARGEGRSAAAGRLALAALAALAVGACTCARPAQPRADGAAAQGVTGPVKQWEIAMSETMTGKVTLLDAVKPGKVKHEREEDRDEVKAVPFVLWGAGGPAAVLAYRDAVLMSRREWVQELLPLAGGGQGAFPLRHRTTWLRLPHRNDWVDVLKPETFATADVNGDGVDELILVRTHGSVEVWSTAKKLHELPTPTRAPHEVYYDGDPVARMALPGREEVFLHLDRAVPEELDPARLPHLGAADQTVIVRVAAGKPSRFTLRGLPPGQLNWVLLAPLNVPGSQEVDELVTLSSHGEGQGPITWLSRFTLDGTAIGAPRQLYGTGARVEGAPDPATDELDYPVVTPQSDRVVAVNRRGDRLYVFAPRKPVNWMRAVDLSFLRQQGGTVEALGVTRGERPLAILWHRSEGKNALYAVDEDGRFHERSGGAWVPSGQPMQPGTVREPGKTPQPFYRATPPRKELKEWVTLMPAGRGAEADEVVVVRSRERTTRALTEDELLAAAKRFLPIERLDKLEEEAEPNLDFEHPNLVRDEAIQKERSERGYWGEIMTLDEWKKHLPSSYAEVEAYRRREYLLSMEVELLRGLRRPEQPELLKEYRERDVYLAWVRSLERTAATEFFVVRRGVEVASVEVPGFCFSGPLDHQLKQPLLSVRVRGGVLDAAVMLTQVPSEEEPRFYAIRAEPKGR